MPHMSSKSQSKFFTNLAATGLLVCAKRQLCVKSLQRQTFIEYEGQNGRVSDATSYAWHISLAASDQVPALLADPVNVKKLQ